MNLLLLNFERSLENLFTVFYDLIFFSLEHFSITI